MTEPDAKTYEEMLRYLFDELTEEERQAMEDRYFADDAWFFELMDLDNELVDRYVRGELRGSELVRFERSLERVPERRQKVANAKVLRKFIREETDSAAAVVELHEPVSVEESQPTWWERISSFLTFRIPVAQFAGASLVVIILLTGLSFLIFERSRSTGIDVANLGENNRTDEFRQKEEALQKQVKEVQERERDLQTQLENERGQTEILDEQLQRERAERNRLLDELERLRRVKETQPKAALPKAGIATVFLTPFSGSKGAGGAAIKNFELGKQTARITATLQIPKESTAASFTVTFGGARLAENLKPQKTKSGYKFITVSLSRNALSYDTDNVISVTGDDANKYNYVFRLAK